MIKAINFTVNFMPIIAKIALLFLSTFLSTNCVTPKITVSVPFLLRVGRSPR